MKFDRSSGIILHPTSLPGKYGIGEIGASAYQWLKFLRRCRCGLWQVLPLGPTGFGDSPYQCFSAFAGNFYMISVDLLLQEKLLTTSDIDDLPTFPVDRVDFGWIIPWKIAVLDRAFDRFIQNGDPQMAAAMEVFKIKNSFWLDDFALFMALKEENNGAPWTAWNAELRDRLPTAITQARKRLETACQRQVFRQFIFSRQWEALRQKAHTLQIKIIGDAPIFVSHDSVDVWANRELFFIDAKGMPTVVAGVPPDYFSRTGQLWGNPLYRWDVHKKNQYRWWLERLKSVLSFVDFLRLDHFRGFSGYWEVPAGLPTAEKGRWVPGPGANFFESIQDELGALPIIAEDLGEITPDVFALRDRFDLPGMKILQFAFDSDSSNLFLPHHYTRNTVAYTGTHDNDTTLGWFTTAPEKEKKYALQYLGIKRQGIEKKINKAMIRAIWSSVAMFAIAPLQDFLELDTQARMNYPGNPSGNWTWRYATTDLKPSLAQRIKLLNTLFGRIAK
jgi:4-alpha-glucanotransferase